jgi:metal-responsive CopG/Arc/MetJ family transcriptional regulator
MTTKPAAMTSKNKHEHFVGVYVSKSILRALDKAANAESTSRSFIIRKLLTEKLKQNEAITLRYSAPHTGKSFD